MNSFGKLAIATAVIILAFFAAGIPDLLTARHRARQKRTMLAMRTAANELEKGRAVAPFRDEWGTPVRIRVRRPHFSLRSAGADREFETADARGMTDSVKERGADIVYNDEAFVQFPDGITYLELPGVTPDPTTRPCASCHPKG